jgi:hypothetical protein
MKAKDVPIWQVSTWIKAYNEVAKSGEDFTETRAIRHALAAVAPLIAAAERERIKQQEQDDYNAAVQAFIAGKHINEIRAIEASVYPAASISRLGGRDLSFSDIYAAIRAQGDA